ncbi:TonB-dependent receptor [Marilutibacter chinensis]|uniref:TonB-dependent receptor n=1 Tax=Marilutibacter chinensis TaxID=2912247 RepID=A0ABS9HXK0_9GAMM|nr:TonB-dependent receptor [Lysobacter chinensis]MCF7222890.1 TonB-dependent receptor [Lysobacter chinensis]
MLQLRRNLLSVALASATALMATGVHAQSAAEPANDQETGNDTATQSPDATTLDSVVVTGIRAGIERAIDAKRESTSIVEAISAEDIGKLPDVSIADSINRLPGLAMQRVAGRSSTVSIRGLSGDYGTTLLNGREQVSVSDNRTVEYDQYPAELINGVVVYKTPDASLVGQGLSGTVDLRTVRPLAFSERVVSLNARYEDNSLGELNPGTDDTGYRASASYIDQFLDDRLGVALGYSRYTAPGQANRWEAWGYPTDGTHHVLGGSKSLASSTDNTRQGLMGVVQFRPNDRYETTLDLFYSEFEKSETTRFLEVGLGWSGATLSNPVVDEDGVVVGGTFTGVRPVLRNDLNEGDDELFAVGWNHKFNFGDYWSAEADLSYSSADRRESILETYSGYRAGITDTVDFTLDRKTGKPTFSFGLDYTDPAQVVLTDPGGWGQDGYIKTPEVEDTLKSFRLNAERLFDTGMFSSVEFGANYSEREKSRSVPEAFLELIGGPDRGAGFDEVAIDPRFILSPVDLSFTGIPGSFSYDINGVLDQYYQQVGNVHADISNKQWTINEEVSTFYVQGNINTDIGSVGIRGNVGVQVVRTDQSSQGFLVVQGDAANAVPNDGGATYTNVLPSLNLSFLLPHDQVLRTAVAKQMARPRIDQLRANSNMSLEFAGQNIGDWTGSGGNPELDPWEADAFDVSYEKYFGDRGYVSAAWFFKDLTSYIYDQQIAVDASDFPIPPGYVGPTPDPVGFYTAPANGKGGRLSGFEFAVSIPFDLFTPALEGFGLQANHSNTNSSIKPNGPDQPSGPIPGLSDEVTNITLYYERAGFQARLSQRKRSDFLGEIQGFGADRTPRYIKGEEVLDAQIGYSFADGTALEGLSLLLQVNNLTDEPYREYFFDNGLAQRYEEYGRQVLFGVSYRF